MGDNSFAPYYQSIQSFVVQNIAASKKVIKIFNYPINPGATRDLLQIPGLDEADIRGSLLKGELRNKILAQEITITQSDIDLLQFSDAQRSFLLAAGITNGLYVTADQAPTLAGGGGTGYNVRQGITLIGLQNGMNRVFNTPESFLNGSFNDNVLDIEVFHNGRRLVQGVDFSVSEAGGVGTGFNTVTLTFSVNSSSVLRANYYVLA